MSKTNSTKKLDRIFGLIILVACILASPILISTIVRFHTQLSYRWAKIGEAQKQQGLWKQQNITSYKIGIRFFGYMSEFPQEYRVLNGMSDKWSSGESCNENNCAFPTIDDLFDRIVKQASSGYCGRDGCACNGPWIMNVVYDEQHKFPKTANRFNGYDARDIFKSWWEDHPICLMEVDFDMIDGWEIYSFIPME